MSSQDTASIRTLNDQLRRDLVSGKVLITRGITARGPNFVALVLSAVRNCNEFDDGNDPYGQHDFGSASVDDELIFWKIDYYDLEMRCGAEYPGDPDRCIRVMTIMTADEY